MTAVTQPTGAQLIPQEPHPFVTAVTQPTGGHVVPQPRVQSPAKVLLVSKNIVAPNRQTEILNIKIFLADSKVCHQK